LKVCFLLFFKKEDKENESYGEEWYYISCKQSFKQLQTNQCVIPPVRKDRRLCTFYWAVISVYIVYELRESLAEW
jgi:hypothetical protein